LSHLSSSQCEEFILSPDKIGTKGDQVKEQSDPPLSATTDFGVAGKRRPGPMKIGPGLFLFGDVTIRAAGR